VIADVLRFLLTMPGGLIPVAATVAAIVLNERANRRRMAPDTCASFAAERHALERATRSDRAGFISPHSPKHRLPARSASRLSRHPVLTVQTDCSAHDEARHSDAATRPVGAQRPER
jgi:hypothetical protein